MKYSDLDHAFNRNMKIMSIHKINKYKSSDSLVVRWKLTDQAYLDRNLEKPFFNIIVKLHPFYPPTKSEGYSFGVVRPHFLSVLNHISVPIGQI